MPRPKKQKPNRADNRYECKITIGRDINGRTIRKSFYSETSLADAREQAEQYKIESKAAELAGEAFITSNQTFAQWGDTWLETYKKGRVKGSTYYGNYEIPLRRHLTPYFGTMMLDDIKPVTVQRFFDQKQDCALESLKKMRACLFSLFEAAVENDLCRKNPVTRNVTVRSKKKPVPKRAYSQADVDIILKFAESHPDGLSIELLLSTGISRSEILGLQWGDVDFDLETIRIERGVTDIKNPETQKWETVVGEPKNDFRKRLIPISHELCEKLKHRYANRAMIVDGSRRKRIKPITKLPLFIFPNARGEAYSPNNWDARVYKPFIKALVAKYPDMEKLNLHELRHTFATIRYNDGADIFALAKVMGHADLKMLYKRYAHEDLDSLRKAAGLIENSDKKSTSVVKVSSEPKKE